jgi:hypothetical protein
MNSKIQLLLSITIVLVSGCIPDCLQKGGPFERYSSSVEESKKQGVFQYQVFISRNKIPLDTNLSLEIQEAWVESWWGSDCINNKYSIIIDTNSKSLILKSKYIGIRKTGIYYFLGRHQIDSNKHYLLHGDTLNFYIYKDSNDFSPELKYRIHTDSLASATPTTIAESYRKIRSKIIDSIQFLKDLKKQL